MRLVTQAADRPQRRGWPTDRARLTFPASENPFLRPGCKNPQGLELTCTRPHTGAPPGTTMGTREGGTTWQGHSGTQAERFERAQHLQARPPGRAGQPQGRKLTASP